MAIEIPKNIKETTKLNLSGRNLSSIPCKVFEYKNLTKLILSHNNIETIPSEITKLKHLKVLDVSHNNIKQIYAPVFNLPRLRILNISYNHIINLPKQIESSQLQFLIASNNEISNIKIDKLSKLKKLVVNDNKLTSLEFNNHNGMLKYIWVGNNPLLNFCVSNDLLSSIRELYTYTSPEKINCISNSYRNLFSKRGNVRNFINSNVVVNDKVSMSQNNKKVMNADLKLKKSPKIFISHSSNDAEIASALVDLLEFLGISYIFCSSVSGYGVHLGENIYQRIKSEYDEHELLMIYLISPEYLHSYMSLNEMGAAWILKNDYLTFILPGLTVDSLDRTCIGKNNIAAIWNGSDINARMNEFKDKMIDLFDISSPDQNRWENRRDEFIKKFQSYHPAPKEEIKAEILSKEQSQNQSNGQNEPVNNIAKDEISEESIIDEMYQLLFQFEKEQLEIEAIRLQISHNEGINSMSDIVRKTWIDGYRVIMSTNILLSKKPDNDVYLAETRAVRAFVYYNMAMLWGNIPLVRSIGLVDINIPPSETEVVYRHCLELLKEGPSIQGLDNRHVTDSFVNILYTELYLSLGQKDLAYSHLKEVSSFNDNIFTLKSVDKNETKSTIDIYTQKYVELLKEEVKGKDNSKAWFDRGAVYGTWAALKRLGMAQSLTGIKEHELLLPIPINATIQNCSLKQNAGY